MEDKKITEDKLRKFEELVERLEKASEKPHPKHPHPEGPDHKHPHPEGPDHKHPHPKHPPIPPHERKDLKIDFKQDEELLEEIFGDDDTAKAVVDIITTSPTEIQIVLKVVIDLYSKVNEQKGE